MSAENPPTKKLPRAQRREQILGAATLLFADSGYAAVGLEQVAAAAGVSRVILYRHFDSKAELFRAGLDRAARSLAEASGEELTEAGAETLLTWASHNTAEFRLLFERAAREPLFQADIDALRDDMTAAVYRQLGAEIPDERWARWAARLSLGFTVEAVMAWLAVGAPEPARAAGLINATLRALFDATQHAHSPKANG
ncbi:MAG: TetR/AcrR family transcriptional regulator [Stackebrandtia sp.]